MKKYYVAIHFIEAFFQLSEEQLIIPYCDLSRFAWKYFMHH